MSFNRRPPLGALQRRLAHGLAQPVAALVKIVPELLLRDETVQVAVEFEEELSDGRLVDRRVREQLLERWITDGVLGGRSGVLRQFRPHTLRHTSIDPSSTCWILLDDTSYNFGRRPYRRGARGDGLEDDAAGPQLGAVSHPNIAQDRAARPQQHVLADFWMPARA